MGARQSTHNSPSRVVIQTNNGDGSLSSSSYSNITTTPYRSGSRSNTNHNNEINDTTTTTSTTNWRERARSLTAVLTGDITSGPGRSSRSSAIDFRSSIRTTTTTSSSQQDMMMVMNNNNDNDDDDETFASFSSNSQPTNFPLQFFHNYYNFNLSNPKCRFCSKTLVSDDIECHEIMCATKHESVNYNDDTLTEDKGECVICLEEMLTGNTIARLPCLCIYHKVCIDAWFNVKRSCPEHPVD